MLTRHATLLLLTAFAVAFPPLIDALPSTINGGNGTIASDSSHATSRSNTATLQVSLNRTADGPVAAVPAGNATAKNGNKTITGADWPNNKIEFGLKTIDLQDAEQIRLNIDHGLCLSLPTVYHRNVVFTACTTRGILDDLRSLWRAEIPGEPRTNSSESTLAARGQPMLPGILLGESLKSTTTSNNYVQIRNLQNNLCLTFRSRDRRAVTEECWSSDDSVDPDSERTRAQMFRFFQAHDQPAGSVKLISAASDDTTDGLYDCLRSAHSYHDDVIMPHDVSFLNAIVEVCDHQQRWQYMRRHPLPSITLLNVARGALDPRQAV